MHNAARLGFAVAHLGYQEWLLDFRNLLRDTSRTSVANDLTQGTLLGVGVGPKYVLLLGRRPGQEVG